MTVCGLMLTVLFGLVGFLQALVFAGGCLLVIRRMASVPEALGVHLNRFLVQLRLGFFCCFRDGYFVKLPFLWT